MRIGGKTWLTYCLNAHPADTLAEVEAALAGPCAAVRRAVAPAGPFAAGLRISARAVGELAGRPARERLRGLLDAEGLAAVTVNGFPYGPFHGTPVKEAVYEPDWRTPERLDYTCALADIMADLAPRSETVTLSTVPGAFRPEGIGAEALIADNLLCAAAHMVELEARSGTRVAIAVEPEPCCLLETVEETVRFFQRHLLSRSAVDRLAALTGLSRGAAADALPRHLGLCYDVCHAAVEFEDPDDSLDALAAAGIPVHKLQLSAALRIPRVTPEARAALAPYAEPTYLHQVVARRGPRGALHRLPDLPEALSRGAAADGEEWRVHFHVPVFVDRAGPFATTQDFLADTLARHARAPIAPHLEVETYTWGVLPPDLAAPSIAGAIARELGWVLDHLGAAPAPRTAEPVGCG